MSETNTKCSTCDDTGIIGERNLVRCVVCFGSGIRFMSKGICLICGGKGRIYCNNPSRFGCNSYTSKYIKCCKCDVNKKIS